MLKITFLAILLFVSSCGEHSANSYNKQHSTHNHVPYLELATANIGVRSILLTKHKRAHIIDFLVIDGDIVYLTKNGYLIKKSIKETKKDTWINRIKIKNEANIINDIHRSNITYNNNNLLISADQYIYMIDYKTGAIKWEKNLNSPIQGNKIVQDTGVIAFTIDESAYYLNISNGSTVWYIQGKEDLIKLKNNADLVSDSKTVIFPYSGTTVTALNVETGEKIWKHESSQDKYASLNSIRYTPLIYKNLLILATNDNSLYAIDINTGEEMWKVDDDISATPLANSNSLFTISRNNKMIVRNIFSGEQKSEISLDENIKWYEPMLLVNDIILTGEGLSRLILIDKLNKTTTVKFPKRLKIIGHPLAIGNMIYTRSNNILHELSLYN